MVLWYHTRLFHDTYSSVTTSSVTTSSVTNFQRTLFPALAQVLMPTLEIVAVVDDDVLSPQYSYRRQVLLRLHRNAIASSEIYWAEPHYIICNVLKQLTAFFLSLHYLVAPTFFSGLKKPSKLPLASAWNMVSPKPNLLLVNALLMWPTLPLTGFYEKYTIVRDNKESGQNLHRCKQKPLRNEHILWRLVKIWEIYMRLSQRIRAFSNPWNFNRKYDKIWLQWRAIYPTRFGTLWYLIVNIGGSHKHLPSVKA